MSTVHPLSTDGPRSIDPTRDSRCSSPRSTVVRLGSVGVEHVTIRPLRGMMRKASLPGLVWFFRPSPHARSEEEIPSRSEGEGVHG
eukprot:scaffold776_cov347-Pavlova_lutheri.AAC.61